MRPPKGLCSSSEGHSSYYAFSPNCRWWDGTSPSFPCAFYCTSLLLSQLLVPPVRARSVCAVANAPKEVIAS